MHVFLWRESRFLKCVAYVWRSSSFPPPLLAQWWLMGRWSLTGSHQHHHDPYLSVNAVSLAIGGDGTDWLSYRAAGSSLGLVVRVRGSLPSSSWPHVNTLKPLLAQRGFFLTYVIIISVLIIQLQWREKEFWLLVMFGSCHQSLTLFQ